MWFKEIRHIYYYYKMEFRKIVNYENYSVSNMGTIRNDKTNRILQPQIDTKGYYCVILYNNSKRKNINIHRLVGVAFVENPDNKICLDHINNNKLDNNISNLRWSTYQENNRNASIRSDNSSGIKGIYWNKKAKKYHTRIKIDGNYIHLGYYDTIEEATEARVNKVNQVFGIYKNACEGINQGAKQMKIRKAKIVVKHIVVPIVLPVKVDMHKIINKLKQLNEHYESKKIFYEQQLQQVLNMKYNKTNI